MCASLFLRALLRRVFAFACLQVCRGARGGIRWGVGRAFASQQVEEAPPGDAQLQEGLGVAPWLIRVGE